MTEVQWLPSPDHAYLQVIVCYDGKEQTTVVRGDWDPETFPARALGEELGMWIQWTFDGRQSKAHLTDPALARYLTRCGVTTRWHILQEIEPVEGIDDLCRRCAGIEAKEKEKARAGGARTFSERGEN